LPFALLILVTLAGLALYTSVFIRGMYHDNLRDQLLSDARLISDVLSLDTGAVVAGELQSRVERYGDLTQQRVTVVAADGVVLADSYERPATMANHLLRPEIQQALVEGAGTSVRFSRTVQFDMMYAAVAVRGASGEVAAVVRTALPLQHIEATVARLRDRIMLGTLLAVAAAVLVAIVLSARISWPIRRLTDVVRRMDAGDMNVYIIPTTQDEVGRLTRAFNEMAERLRRAIIGVNKERGQLAAVLEHMADGVIITDAEGAVQLVNPAALRLLGQGDVPVLGRSLAQVVREHQIAEVWQASLDDGEERVDLVEAGHRGPFLRVIATPLRAAEPGSCLLILQDLSQIRRLETVRREFVSNISHELRTPLASLRAVADTLRDGALEDPPAAHRFLDRMEAEIDSLTQMVQELLELSRIESGQVPIRLAPVSLDGVITPAVERLRLQMERSELALELDIPTDLPLVLGDAGRLQQVVTNLVHNAIKFTPAGGTISIDAAARGDEVIVMVSDTGVGIPTDMLPRIFERFYKADRARSGGGTGLGLAIAKHIVQGHGGQIWAESVEGRGSSFYFSLLPAGAGPTVRQ
jgi:two-component system phosphate regulon sensor histidine kinase PhoR